MAMPLIMLLTSCVSTKIKYVVPDIDFPTFPLVENISNNGDGTVTVDSDWIVRLAEYSIKIKETEDNYMGIKELYENGGEKNRQK